jgi:SEL1 protein
MKLPLWRWLQVIGGYLTVDADILLTYGTVLLQVFPTVSLARQEAKQDIVSNKGSIQPSSEKPWGSDFVSHDAPVNSREVRNGNTDVHEAWASLRKLAQTEDATSSLSKPTGVLGTTWYYSKTLFRLLFMNGPTKLEREDGETEHSSLSKALAKEVAVLKNAASENDLDAIYLLAEMNFYGNFTHPRNFRVAFEGYDRLASLTGNHTAQYMLGLMYATGIGGAVERDQAKALLYHTFAAEQGNTRSEMTVAFRHHSGIGTPRDCDKAARYYRRVAEKAMAYWRSGPPGGQNMPKMSYRWAEDSGGVYGEGASFSSSGHNANKDGTIYTNIDDILEFLDVRERQGDMHATFNLGRHYYEGSRSRKRNLKMARNQFMKIARVYWGKDGKVSPKAPKGIDKIAAKAAAHIGRMFLRGEGTEQSFEKAATWFRRGIANGDALCQHHMALMYRDGLGVPKDSLRAAVYFKAAAEQDLPASQSALGALFLDQGDVDTAGRYFELAARNGFTEAFYYLAEMTNNEIGRERQCGIATAYYKIVAEKAEALHSSFAQANAAYASGDRETAMIYSMMAAEQGYESAQANVAYILDEQTSCLSTALSSALPSFPRPQPTASSRLILHNAALALIYWTRSAKQNNIDSLVKMGDYYLSGQGTTADVDKASTCYHTAAEIHHSAQALWNLGWMHENGVGPVSQDFHMAKRYYDLALDMNSEAYLPVKLALIKLRIRSWWNGVTGGKINGIKREDDIDENRKPRSLSEWIAHFLDAAGEMNEQDQGALDDLELDSPAFGSDPMPGGEDNYDDFDDGLLESLIIIGLAATLAFLVYYRQQRQLQNRRVALAAQAANAPRNAPAPAGAEPLAAGPGAEAGVAPPVGDGDRGFFPNPGDPDWNQWVAGGVGH